MTQTKTLVISSLVQRNSGCLHKRTIVGGCVCGRSHLLELKYTFHDSVCIRASPQPRYLLHSTIHIEDINKNNLKV